MTAITTAVSSVISLGTTVLSTISGDATLCLMALGFPISFKAVHFVKSLLY